MGKKIIISESQYKRVFLNEQSSIDDIIVYFNEDKGNIIEQTARLYRLWANSTPELSKKYGKESEFDLDASRKPANSGTFEKSFSKGKSQFDKDWLIVPKEKDFLLFTKGGRTYYSVGTKKVLPEKLTDQDYFYIVYPGGRDSIDRDEYIVDGEIYASGKGSKIKEEIKNIYSSSNTKKATNVTQKEKESDIEKKLVSFRNTIDDLEDMGLGVRDPLRGWLIPYKKNQTFKNAEDIPSDNYLFARTAINAMEYLDYLKANKTITGVKGSSTVCVTKLGRSCLGASPYITSNTYTLNLAKALGNKKIGNYPANYVVYDHGFQFHWGKIVEDLENKFKSDKFAYKSSLFPDGWWNYFTQSYNIGGSFNKVVSSINSIGSGDIPKIKTLNKYEKGAFIFDPSSWGMDHHDWLDVAAAILFFIPGGQPLSLGIEIINSASYVMEGDYTTGGIGLALTLLPFGGPIIRRIGGNGVKKINNVVEETNKFIKNNPNATEKEIGEFITEKSNKLNPAEIDALQTLTDQKNIDLIRKDVDDLSKLNKTELKNKLTERSDALSEYLYGYGTKSKYWERQITASSFERVIVSSIILMGVFMDDKTDEEASKELNENGYENITPQDISKIKVDASELLNAINNFDYENFEVVEQDTSKQQLINDLNNLLTIVDTVGSDSEIYEEKVKPYINDSKVLYDIYNIVTKDEELSDIEYRELSEDVDYNWYKLLDCENDPYSRTNIVIDNEEKTQTKEYQDKVNQLGSPLSLRGDSKYEYKEYNDFWFWKLKGSSGKWNLIKNCLACSKLQRQLNKELEEFNFQFDFENELNYELDKR